MRRREGEGEAPDRLRGRPVRRLARDMSRMVVENDLDRSVGGVGSVEEFKVLDKFAASVAVPDQSVDVSSEQIDTRQQGHGAVAFVLVVTHDGGTDAGKWRAIRCRRADGLDPRFLVVRDDRDAPIRAALALVLPLFGLLAQ